MKNRRKVKEIIWAEGIFSAKITVEYFDTLEKLDNSTILIDGIKNGIVINFPGIIRNI